MSETTPAAPSYAKRGKSRTPIIIIAIVVIALIIGAAVFFFSKPDGTKNAADNEITIGLVLEPSSLDVRENTGVATGQILIDNVYQGLVGIKPGSVAEIVPVLATEMPQVSDDGREYTFSLQQGVKFHSGNVMTADDVVDSLTASLLDTTVGFTPTITKIDEQTVKITLAEPNSMLLWVLANQSGLILETAATNNLQSSANGTGPYTFEQWKKGDSLTLARNADYWGEAATLDRAVFRFFPEGRAAVNALKEGDLDVHTALLPPLRAEFENNSNFTLVRADSSDVFTLAYNSQQAPLNDPKVRQALSMAIDSDALLGTQNGDAKVIGSPITELEPGYTDLTDVNAFDPEGARALLLEAGHPNLSLTITAPNHYDTTSLDLVTSQLAAVGVSVKVKSVEFATWLSEVYQNRDYQLSYVDHAEARDFANYANPDYYFGYNNADVQKLYAEALASTDADKSDELLQEAATMVAQDAPAKWLFNYTPTNVVSTEVTGFPEVNTNSRVNLAEVTVN
ncbi:ABC transporter substrate-binding protein [Leucobacter sp. cx-328]|uniref:ABC transporter substrate-binding protein n=1 Tax=unclassified Leucobacter TaxID=2621730 RepID=UPI00165EB8A0|nr:ABC transporter substrate-binding protein [Leucobacter sp. cx-328]